MTTDPIVDKVRAIAARLARPERTPPHADGETPLGEGGFGLDSLDFLELIVACEEQFGILFEPEGELTRQSLTTVGSLAVTIRRKTAEGSG